jgi:hypothetical protein
LNKLEIAVKALKEIKDTQGKVCVDFEFCKHESCISSVASWMIADKALKEIGNLTNEAFILRTLT